MDSGNPPAQGPNKPPGELVEFFVCDVCHARRFPTAAAAEAHERSCTGPGTAPSVASGAMDTTHPPAAATTTHQRPRSDSDGIVNKTLFKCRKCKILFWTTREAAAHEKDCEEAQWHNCPICNVLRFRTREEVAAHQIGCRGPMPLRIADLPLAERLQGRNGTGGGVGGGGTTSDAASIVGAAAAAAAAAGGNVPDPLAAAPDDARPKEAVAAGNTGAENEESDSSSSIEIIGVTKPPPKEEPPPTEAPVDSAPTEAPSEKAAPDAEEEKAAEDAKDYVQVWTCDVCKEEQFEDYDHAVAHEASCTGPKRDLVEVDADGSPAKPSQVVLFAPLLDKHVDSTNFMQISKYERLALKSVQLLYTPKPSGGELSFQCLHCATPLSPDGTDQTWTAGKIGTKVHAFACQHGRFCNAAPANERATLSNADASRRGKMALGAFLAGYFAENGIRENRRDGGGFVVMKDEEFRKVPGYELTKRGKQLQGGKKRRGKPTAKSPAKRPKGGKAELAPRSKHKDIRYGDMGCKMHSEEGAIFTLGPLDGLPLLCSFSREAAQKLQPSEKFLLQQIELFSVQPKHMESAKMDVSEPCVGIRCRNCIADKEGCCFAKLSSVQSLSRSILLMATEHLLGGCRFMKAKDVKMIQEFGDKKHRHFMEKYCNWLAKLYSMEDATSSSGPCVVWGESPTVTGEYADPGDVDIEIVLGAPMPDLEVEEEPKAGAESKEPSPVPPPSGDSSLTVPLEKKLPPPSATSDSSAVEALKPTPAASSNSTSGDGGEEEGLAVASSSMTNAPPGPHIDTDAVLNGLQQRKPS